MAHSRGSPVSKRLLMVMTLALILVSFVPLAVREFPDLQAWLKTWVMPELH